MAAQTQNATKISHIIFDMDGLLLNTEALYFEAFDAVLRRFDRRYSFDVQSRLLGSPPRICARKMIDEYDLPINEDEWIEKLAVEQEKLFSSKARFMPGIPKLLHHLYKNGIPLGIATSSGNEQFAMKTRELENLFGFFAHVTKTGEKAVNRGKPHPDIYLVAMNKFGDDDLKAENVLAFEDSPIGIASAKSAGMTAVMIPDPRLDSTLTLEADKVLKTAHDLRPDEFGLPSYGYKNVTHVIFDMDGILLDTTKVGTSIMKAILEENGKEFRPELSPVFAGRRFVDSVPLMIKHYDLDNFTPEELSRVYVEKIKAFNKNFVPDLMEGAEKLVRHLHGHGVPNAVATSSAKVSFEEKIKTHAELFDLFGVVVKGEDVKEGKPNPEPYLKAAELLKVEPERCLVFEDAVNGVKAAKAAGMQSVLVLERYVQVPVDETLIADQLLTTLDDFRPEDFGLPQFE